MMKKMMFSFASAIAFMLLSCSGDSTQVEAEVDQTEPQVTRAAKGTEPCDLIDLKVLRSHFDIDESTEVKVDQIGNFPTCSYEWGTDLYKSTVQAGNMSIDYTAPAKVMLVIASNVDQAGFEKSTSVYKDPETISGIGKMATWSSAMSQLSFLAGSTLYHVNVKVTGDNEKDKQKALDLANVILDKV